jgi:hypothetical protein
VILSTLAIIGLITAPFFIKYIPIYHGDVMVMVKSSQSKATRSYLFGYWIHSMLLLGCTHQSHIHITNALPHVGIHTIITYTYIPVCFNKDNVNSPIMAECNVPGCDCNDACNPASSLNKLSFAYHPSYIHHESDMGGTIWDQKVTSLNGVSCDRRSTRSSAV